MTKNELLKRELNAVIKTVNLTKYYDGKPVLNSVSMTVNKGDIYGFIGNNGAGKTTFIRCIMGLVPYDSGKIELFGKSGYRGLTEARKKVGCIVETPALLLNVNALNCLKNHALLYGITDVQKMNELLELTGISNTGNKKVKDFSLGMRQRMAICQALINDPEILILDEPTNGMDPQGIIDIRNLLITLSQEKNITILVSSHYLSELQQFATRFGIIKQGVLTNELYREELASDSLEKYFLTKTGDE
jgi:ABC-2 type transport system ATP-binding protein